MNKRELGNYYTIISPFDLIPFSEWLEKVGNINVILEPFCGINNIPYRLQQYNWDCYNIDYTGRNLTPQFEIKQNDSIENYPQGFKVAITNPPYLGKSSASRRHLQYKYPEYPDLYLKCLEVMLKNTNYVAAILPESFITSPFFKERLDSVVTLECKMFEDTECPVCLAMFVPEVSDDFKVYSMNRYRGTYKELKEYNVKPVDDYGWTFNCKGGDIGLVCIDSSTDNRIRFTKGENISDDNIAYSSRSITKIKPQTAVQNIDGLIQSANEILNSFREKTTDVFLTSFKGLRKDGKYRRRIKFSQARDILNESIKHVLL